MNADLISVFLPALVAGILVLLTHVILGIQVLKRGIIFIDLAIAQVASIGMIIVHTSHDLASLYGSQYWLPGLFALTAGYVIGQFEKKLANELEAIIGCIYVLSISISMLLLAKDPHGGELLKRVLAGNILWVNWSQLLLPAVISFLVLAIITLRPVMLSGDKFYLLFALVVTTSLELVGVFLVFSSLIFPALATRQLKKNLSLLFGFLLGVGGYLLGLLLSAQWDLPSGATIVLCLGICSLLFRLAMSRCNQQF